MRAAVVALLVLAACGNDAAKTVLSSSTTAPSTSTTVPGTAPSRSSPTTSSARPPGATTTAARSGGACPLAAVPAGATDVSTRSGDFDGNHTADTLRAYRSGPDWHLRVELAGAAFGADAIVPDVDPGTALRPLGGFDIGGKPGDEAFAVVGNGAATTFLGVFVLDGCKLTRVTEKGDPSRYGVGATVLHRSGVSCVLGTALQTFTGTAPPATGTPFTVVRATYDLVGSTLVLANTTQSVIAADDPALRPSGTLDCGRLSLG